MPKIKVNGRIISITKPYKRPTTVDQTVGGGIGDARNYLEQLQSNLSRRMLSQESNQNLDDLNEIIRKDNGQVVHLCENSEEDCSKIYAISNKLNQDARDYKNKTGSSAITNAQVVQPDLIGRS